MTTKDLKSAMFAVGLGLAVLALTMAVSTGPAATESEGCYCRGTVGNVNCDYADRVTLGDLALLIDYLYISGVRLPNLEEANIDGDPDGVIDVADVAVLIDHLFISWVALPLCPLPLNAPPETRIVGLIGDQPFIDGLAPGLASTGVYVDWLAEDLVDHPYSQPTFESEYRLYGPYPDSLLNLVLDSFSVRVFHPNDYTWLEFGRPPDTLNCDTVFSGDQIDTITCHTLGTHWVVCDTTWDGGVREIVCDTLLIDTLSGAAAYGRIDTRLDVLDPGFVGNPDLNRIALVSQEGGDTWTTDATDTLYNVFAGHQTDTTQLMNFIFWVRSRDPVDSTLYDPTPAFAPLKVLNPKFERDVLVINWSSGAHENRVYSDSAAAYWKRAIDAWAAHSSPQTTIFFDSTRDLVWAADYNNDYGLLNTALKYKILILQQDAAISGTWSVSRPLRRQVFEAVATGSSAWVAARVPVGSHPFGSGPATHVVTDDYATVFGVEQITFSGWGSGLFDDQDGYGMGRPRIEDFIGAYSEDTGRWPDLTVDTSFLHHRYDWQGSLDPPQFPYYPFLGEIGALPEVGWAEPAPEAEVMYRYRSLYGATHPIVPELSFEGYPVVHRVDRGVFRTVHALFTPMVLEGAGADIMTNLVLDWLYEPWLSAATAIRYPHSAMIESTERDLRQLCLKWRRSTVTEGVQSKEATGAAK